MTLCKNGQILNCCHPNALMTLKEYLVDYASADTRKVGEALIEKELCNIPKEKVRQIAEEYIKEIEHGKSGSTSVFSAGATPESPVWSMQ